MKVLVTGVAGFIGSSLATRLLGLGHTVVGVDSLTDYYSSELKSSNLANLTDANFKFVQCDLNTANVDDLFDGVQVVFHQAGQPGVRKSWGDDFRTYTLQNIDATQRLLESASRSKTLVRFVYASSSSVYGDAERYPTKESDVPMPLSPYGVTKLAAEHLCSLYGKNFGVPTVSLRYFTVYGPRQRPDMAFTRFIRAALCDEEITIYGTGRQIRDFTFIDDVVSANLTAGFSDGVAPASVFNVAGGSSISVNEVLDVIQGLTPEKLRIQRGSPVMGDVGRTGGSTDLIKESLGWEASVSIEDGIASQYEWGKSVFLQSHS